MLKNGTYIADRYEVVGQIGTGGMSDVYKAKDHTLGRYVAIKVLKEEFSEDTNFVTKFRSEAQAAAGLEHPNIVNIYDVGSENGIHYIVMEYVEGITLKTYIEKKGQLNYKETLSIAIQVSRGIQAAHAKHIIHRDIKPQNIIISTDGKVKVTDFGIARAVSEHTIHSDVMGSVHYASPEQARNGYVSNRSDIYSLGIVMYEMVTGRVPFDGDSTVAVAIQHLQDEMVPPSTYAPNLPISLEKIIQKCTQKSPDRRYDSMESLLIDLRKALLNPNEDFVTLVPFNQDKTKTRVLTDDEVSQIRKQAETVNPEPEKKTMAQEVPEEDDEDYDMSEYDEDDDEEEGRFLNSKMEKIVGIMRIVVAVIIAIIVIYLIGSFFDIFHFGPGNKNNKKDDTQITQEEKETVVMIDLKGKTLSEAEKDLKELGLKVTEAGTEVSDTYEKDLSKYQGQEIEFVISEFNPRRNRVIGDRRQLLVAERAEKQKELFANLHVGDTVEGVVKNVTDFGAFIDLGGVDGLLHISEMSWGRVENPKKVFQVGEKLKVLVKDIHDTKIALSLKFPESNPWANAAEDYAVGKEITGKVARMTDFGAFVELAPGVDALLHVSQISRAHVEKPSDVLSVGQEITAKIVDLNEAEKKISLSMKALEKPEEASEGEEA